MEDRDTMEAVMKTPSRKLFRKNFKKGSKFETAGSTLKATLGNVPDLKQAIILPDDEDINTWLSVNTVYFYNAMSLLYGTCIRFCTPETCPTMRVGTYEFFWSFDEENRQKPVKLPAPEYLSLLLDWIQDQLTDKSMFPEDDEGPFPEDFRKTAKRMFRRMCRFFGHFYHSHFVDVQESGLEGHLNSSFKHFMLFALEFDLVDDKECQMMKKVINRLKFMPIIA